MGFRRNVFINCPFDEEYLPLLRPLLFCVVYLGFDPQIASQYGDSGSPRIDNIVEMIEKSQYAIHDLSRCRSTEAGEYFRLNMPFELGVDIGCRLFGRPPLTQKRCLILEAERFRYQAALSDLSNSVIAAHANSPAKLLTEVRNWLNDQAKLGEKGPNYVWGRFNDFMAANYDELKEHGYSDHDIGRLPTGELIVAMKEWVTTNKN